MRAILFATLLAAASALRLGSVRTVDAQEWGGSSVGQQCVKTVPLKGTTDEATKITEYNFKYGTAKRWEEASMVELPTAGDDYHANDDYHQCIQGYCLMCGFTPVAKSELDRGTIGQEDCLYIGMYVSEDHREEGKLLPMVFHIHHGQNYYGFRAPLDEVKSVAKNGIVVASANFRLAAMGTFAHPQVKQPNLGISDLILALKFVQLYGCNVGADTGRVTLTGSSTGASNVGALLQSPAAKGLFSAAWINSPVAIGELGSDFSKEEAYEKFTKPCLKATGCGDEDIDCLRAKEAPDLFYAWEATRNHECTLTMQRIKGHQDENPMFDFNRAPWDGTIIPDAKGNPCTRSFANAHVPIVVGFGLNELDNNKGLFDLPKMSAQSLNLWLEQTGHSANENSCVREKLLITQDFQSHVEEGMFTRGAYLMATKSAWKGGKSGPRWSFLANSPASSTHRSWHSLVELLVWNPDINEATTYWDPGAKRFILGGASDELRQYAFEQFSNFIKNGKPADSTWPETQLVTEQDGNTELGGLPMKLWSNTPASVPELTRNYHHTNATIKTSHDIRCNKKVPDDVDGFDLRHCKGSDARADGGVNVFAKATRKHLIDKPAEGEPFYKGWGKWFVNEVKIKFNNKMAVGK